MDRRTRMLRAIWARLNSYKRAGGSILRGDVRRTASDRRELAQIIRAMRAGRTRESRTSKRIKKATQALGLSGFSRYKRERYLDPWTLKRSLTYKNIEKLSQRRLRKAG